LNDFVAFSNNLSAIKGFRTSSGAPNLSMAFKRAFISISDLLFYRCS
jgi:hypothetical protein